MRPDRVRAVTLSIVEATPRTRWIFIEIETSAGLCGVGEATLAGQENAVAAAVRSLAAMVLALPDAAPSQLPRQLPDTLAAAAARSALDHALWDIAAQRDGVGLAEALGPVHRTAIPVYANINRRTQDRAPAAFAESARAAVAAGHTAIKLAPFDEADAAETDSGAVAPGLARLAAVRDAISTDIDLLVDCHWRLSPATVELVIAAATEMGVSWLECPFPETSETIAAIVRARDAANRRGITLAGLESAVGIEGFRPFMRAGAYDVMMPDVKYVGGLTEMLRLAEELRAAGIGFSPHNPSGPISHAISLHVCAAAPVLLRLETQFDETPLFDALIQLPLAGVEAGAITIPGGIGTGVRLAREAMGRHRLAHWTTDQDQKTIPTWREHARTDAPRGG